MLVYTQCLSALLWQLSKINITYLAFTILWRSPVSETDLLRKKKCLCWFLTLIRSVANVHLAFLIVVGRESRELDWLAVKSVKVDQAGGLCAAEVWNSDQKNFLSARTCWEGRRKRTNINTLEAPKIYWANSMRYTLHLDKKERVYVFTLERLKSN